MESGIACKRIMQYTRLHCTIRLYRELNENFKSGKSTGGMEQVYIGQQIRIDVLRVIIVGSA